LVGLIAPPKFILLPPQPLDRYRALLGSEQFAGIERIAARARQEFSGHAIWHVSSTARGGGVAELLRSLLPYVRGAGIDTRWVILRDGDDFFTITKRLHNHLHGSSGDGGTLGVDERRVYEATLALNCAYLARLIQRGDVVYLHDPQSAGLVPMLRELGVKVIWRCHIGVDEPNALAREAWNFLRPYVEAADACIFSRREFVWEGLDEEKVWLMAPCIDAFTPKNQDLAPAVVEAILGVGGFEESPSGGIAPSSCWRAARRPRKLLTAMLNPSAIRLAPPRISTTLALRSAPSTPATTAKVVTAPSIAP
jgi:trehalose synthase